MAAKMDDLLGSSIRVDRRFHHQRYSDISNKCGGQRRMLLSSFLGQLRGQIGVRNLVLLIVLLHRTLVIHFLLLAYSGHNPSSDIGDG